MTEPRTEAGRALARQTLGKAVTIDQILAIEAAALAASEPSEPERLREAAYWFRAMVASGGPDSSDLDLAVMQDLDAALGDWKPDMTYPGTGARR